MEQVVTHYGETIQEHSVEWYKKQLLKDWSVQFIKDSLLPQLFEWSNAYKAAVELTKEKGEMKMTEKIETIEEVTIETLDKEFEDPKLSESQEIEIKEATKIIKELRVEEVLRENEARFYMIGSNFEEAAKRNYLAGFGFKLEDATLVLLGNDETEVYYMVVSDLSKLSEDIKHFRNKVLSYEGALNPEFEKVELTFSSPKEDFRVVDDIESIEITR